MKISMTAVGADNYWCLTIKLGKYEKAKEAALKAPLIPACRETLLAETLTGKEAVEKYQENLLHFTKYGAYLSIVGMRNYTGYSDEQRLEISLVAEKLLLLIGGENSGFGELFQTHCKFSRCIAI